MTEETGEKAKEEIEETIGETDVMITEVAAAVVTEVVVAVTEVEEEEEDKLFRV